jgi:protein regulator of cytokinesis 1
MIPMTVDTSYLTTQVNTIVTQLHAIFDDIGVPSHERETREAEVWCLIPALVVLNGGC